MKRYTSALFHPRELRKESRIRRGGQILIDTHGEILYTSIHKKRLLIGLSAASDLLHSRNQESSTGRLPCHRR